MNAAAARDDEDNGDDVSKSFATSSSQTASINTSAFYRADDLPAAQPPASKH